MAIVPIPEKPVLPNAPAFRDPAVQKFGQDLVRMLYSQMSLVARRANASVWIDPGDDQTAGKLLEFTGLGNKVAASSQSGVSPDNAEGLAALMAASVGIPVKTAHNAYVARSIVGTANQVTVSNGNGVSGNPTISLPSRIKLVDTVNNGIASTEYIQFFSADGINFGYVGKGSASDGDVYVSALGTGRKVQLAANNGVLITYGQLQFPLTQNPSTDPNTLDDYEEGTWFPTYVMEGTNFSSISYDIRAGQYIKVGRRVLVSGTLRTSAIVMGSASGILNVGGLPFAPDLSAVSWSGFVGYAQGWAAVAPTQMYFTTSLGARLAYQTGGADSSVLTQTALGTGGGSNLIIFTLEYNAAS